MSGTNLTPRINAHIALVLMVAFIIWGGLTGGWIMFLMACLLVIGFVLSVAMLSRPYLFVAFMLSWYLFAFLSSNTYFPSLHNRFYFIFRFVDEALFVPLVFCLIAQFALRHSLAGKAVIGAALVATCVIVVSGLLNASSVSAMGRYLMAYYVYVLVFVCVATFYHPNKDQLRKLIHVIVFVLFCQLFLNVFFVLGIEVLPNRFIGQWDDAAVGTMALSSTMSYYVIAVMGVAVAWLGAAGTEKGRLYWSIILGVCVLLVAVAHSKHTVVPIAGQLVLIVLVTTRGKVFRKLMLVILGVAMLYGLFEAYNQAYRNIGQSLHDEQLLAQVGKEQLDVYVNVFRTLTRERSWLFGMGPGRYSSVVAMWDRTPLFMEHFYAEIYAERYNPRSSIMLYPRTGILSLLGDTGVFGLLAYISILSTIGLRVFKRLRDGHAYSPQARALSIGWLGWIVFYGLLHTIIDYLHYGLLPVLTFAWGGLVWYLSEQPDEEMVALQDAKTEDGDGA